MRTINTTNETNGHAVPQPEHLFTHLNQLRQLYEDADSDDSARADEEVKGYLGQLHNNDSLDRRISAEAAESNLGTTVSGSWSRIKTYRQQNHKNRYHDDSGIISTICDHTVLARLFVQ